MFNRKCLKSESGKAARKQVLTEKSRFICIRISWSCSADSGRTSYFKSQIYIRYQRTPELRFASIADISEIGLAMSLETTRCRRAWNNLKLLTDPALLSCGVPSWKKEGQAQSKLPAVGFPALFPTRKGQTRCLMLLVQPESLGHGCQSVVGGWVET